MMTSIKDIFTGDGDPPPCPECRKHGRPVSLVKFYGIINAPPGVDIIHYRCTDCGHEWEVSTPTSVKQADESEGNNGQPTGY